MKKNIFYFLCTILLSITTSWCSTNRINLSHNSEDTIFSNNWPTLNEDVTNLRSYMKDVTLDQEDSIIGATQNGLYFEWGSNNIANLVKKIADSGYNVAEYIKLANTLALFGMSEDIINAAYDIATAVIEKIKKDNYSLYNLIKNPNLLRTNISQIPLNIFYKAYTTENKKLLPRITKSQRSIYNHSKNIDNNKVKKYT